MKTSPSRSFGWLPGLLLLLGCDTTEPEPRLKLPAVTSVGANTLGFEVDERVWGNYGRICFRAGGGGCLENELQAYLSTFNGVRSLSVSAGLATARHQESFGLRIDTLRGTGTYWARQPPASSMPGGVATGGTGLTLREERRRQLFVSRAKSTRIVLTRVDTVRRIVSGTFEGRLEEGFTPGTFITIRNGRFDVTY